MSHDDIPQPEDAPREAIWYAATAITSGFRQVPRKHRSCDYLGSYVDTSMYIPGSNSCRVSISYAARADFFSQVPSGAKVLAADGELLRHNDTWDEAKLVLQFVDGSNWSLHHHYVDGKTVVDISQVAGAGSPRTD